MMTILKKFMQHNWVATIYFNFKMLPFKQAVHLPFDLYHNVRLESLKGKVILHSPNIYRGIVKIGGRGSDIFPRRETVLSIDGTLCFNGQTEIGNGASIVVCTYGSMCMGNKVRIGAQCKVYCEKEIILGNEVGISWDCQIFDTNFHDMEDLNSGQLIQKNSAINIGSCCWIGNSSNVMKGTILPDNTTVAANSLANKDYSNIPAFSILAGVPAKIVKTNIKRIYE